MLVPIYSEGRYSLEFAQHVLNGQDVGDGLVVGQLKRNSDARKLYPTRLFYDGLVYMVILTGPHIPSPHTSARSLPLYSGQHFEPDPVSEQRGEKHAGKCRCAPLFLINRADVISLFFQSSG